MFKHISIITLILLATHSDANPCKSDQVTLQVLGSGGPELDDGRYSSGYLIWYNDKAQVLIDAGLGSSIKYGKSGAKFENLKGILLTQGQTTCVITFYETLIGSSRKNTRHYSSKLSRAYTPCYRWHDC